MINQTHELRIGKRRVPIERVPSRVDDVALLGHVVWTIVIVLLAWRVLT